MIKFLLKFLFFLLIIISSFIFFLSYFGIETNKFDSLIKEKSNEVNENIKLEFNSTKIYFNPSELNLAVKLKEPIATTRITKHIFIFLYIISIFKVLGHNHSLPKGGILKFYSM